MRVLDQLPEGKPLAILRELNQVSREIKARQTRGSGSVINHRIYSALPYDILVPGDYAKVVVEVEFLPDNTRFSGALCYRAYAEIASPGTPFIDEIGLRRVIVDPTDGRQRWRFQGQFPSATGLKFYFLAQGSGTFTTKRIQ
ncbi:hypothetical protein [Paeniglutamicibacter sp. NPDC091659]|uniref:hypothetical protein n=1 Tax=Paeniglutamicibacter sp. NPDC091659 TaxID=3364389 RepID=UPI00382D980B